MEEEKYYNEIEHIIKRQEVNKRTRELQENYETVRNYWSIGKLLVEAQGGENRAKYGNELIKKWSDKFAKDYGKGYDVTNLKRFRQFYLLFSKGTPLVSELSWSHYQYIIPIKDETKRNYYINLCIKNNLSKRALIREIKSNSYERLIDKPKYIDIIQPKNEITITTDMKNPIIVNLKENEKIESEKDLELKLLSELNLFFSQLGEGFALIGNQYKIGGNIIDLLLFNIELNCYVVVELKVRELRKQDKGQIEFYMTLVDKFKKKPTHNKTMGILITKEQDEFVASFVRSVDVVPLTYKLNECKEP